MSVAVCCSVLQCVAVCCSECCSVLQRVAVWCNECCSVMRCVAVSVAVYCSAQQSRARVRVQPPIAQALLHSVAVCVAVWCSDMTHSHVWHDSFMCNTSPLVFIVDNHSICTSASVTAIGQTPAHYKVYWILWESSILCRELARVTTKYTAKYIYTLQSTLPNILLYTGYTPEIWEWHTLCGFLESQIITKYCIQWIFIFCEICTSIALQNTVYDGCTDFSKYCVYNGHTETLHPLYYKYYIHCTTNIVVLKHYIHCTTNITSIVLQIL